MSGLSELRFVRRCMTNLEFHADDATSRTTNTRRPTLFRPQEADLFLAAIAPYSLWRPVGSAHSSPSKPVNSSAETLSRVTVSDALQMPWHRSPQSNRDARSVPPLDRPHEENSTKRTQPYVRPPQQRTGPYLRTGERRSGYLHRRAQRSA